jgi:hypothetical protein
MMVLAFVSCARDSGEPPVIPPPTDPLSRRVIGYGVVSASYTHVVSEPQGGGSLGYLRRGSLVKVLERRGSASPEGDESWVLVEGTYQGWLPGGVIQIYDSEARARTAAESMAR